MNTKIMIYLQEKLETHYTAYYDAINQGLTVNSIRTNIFSSFKENK